MKKRTNVQDINRNVYVFLLPLVVLLIFCFLNTSAQAVDLIAGQNMDIGDVIVSNTGTNLEVTYQTSDGWALSETHLAVACDKNGIPLNQSGHPVIGHFPYSTNHDPFVTSFTYTIPLSELSSTCNSPGDTIVLAAHAVVFNTLDLQSLQVISGELIEVPDRFGFSSNGDVKTQVLRRRPGDAPYSFDDAFAEIDPPHQAKLAWEPCDALPFCPTPDANPPDPTPDPSLWDNNIDDSPAGQALLNAGADWIWESYLAQDPVVGTVIRLKRTFDIPGDPQTGTLNITCDNGYEAFINGTSVGSAQVLGDWKNSNLRQAFVDVDNWQSVESWNVGAYLHKGLNTLIIDAGNEEMIQGHDGHQNDGTVVRNPAGCIFMLSTNYAKDETAWGEGTRFVISGTWAMYFEYLLQ